MTAVTATVAGPSARQLGSRLWLPLALVVVVLGGALAIGLARSGAVRGELDPDAVDQQGARAVRVLLEDRGVPVRRATDLAEAPAGSTVFVPFPTRLTDRTVDDLAALAGVDRIVLVHPDAITLRALTGHLLPVGSTGVEPVDPGCDLPEAVLAGRAELGGRTYDTDGAGTTCYDGALADATTKTGVRLIVVGDGSFLENGSLAAEGNAALALGLLGAGDTPVGQVQWLMPAPGAASDDGQLSIRELVPPWVPPAAIELLAGAVLLALWRGRRLGKPVAEPLPVVVRAVETVEGRGRLYQRAGARRQAADALRAGTLSRLVPRLGAGATPPPAAVIAGVSTRSGRPGEHVHAILYGPPPPDDASLLQLAADLDALERATLS